MALTALAGAVGLAAISWAGIPIRKLYRPLKVDRILELDVAGNCEVREGVR